MSYMKYNAEISANLECGDQSIKAAKSFLTAIKSLIYDKSSQDT